MLQYFTKLIIQMCYKFDYRYHIILRGFKWKKEWFEINMLNDWCTVFISFTLLVKSPVNPCLYEYLAQNWIDAKTST